jgi:hypothetical protein
MSRQKELFPIRFHQDDETGMNYIGEIEGYSDEEIDKYIERFGTKGINDLVNHFAFLIYKVKNKQYVIQQRLNYYASCDASSK